MKHLLVVIDIIFLLVLGLNADTNINILKTDKYNYEQKILREKQEQERIRREDKIEDITSHYNKYVITNKETDLYNEEHEKVGKINQGINLILDKVEIDDKTDYFFIPQLGYYISYQDVDKSEESFINRNYQKYIPFNYSVVTKSEITLYDENGYAFKLKSGINKPVLIKDTNKYYIEYNNRLYYVKSNDIKLTKQVNSKEEARSNILVLTYHAIYKDGETCKNKIICHPYKQFDSHMKYLHDNDYLTLTMDELVLFLDKKINIPAKTLVVTMDDGNGYKNAVEIVEKYKIYLTYFVITGRYNSYKLKSNYVPNNLSHHSILDHPKLSLSDTIDLQLTQHSKHDLLTKL